MTAVFYLLLASNVAFAVLASTLHRRLRAERLRTGVAEAAAELDRQARAAESLLWTVGR